MASSPIDLSAAFAKEVRFGPGTLIVELVDGRVLAVPLEWYPRLAQGNSEERAKWELIGRGHGIHWPMLDEDLNVEDLLAGRRSGESQESFKRWLHSRLR